MTTPITIVGRSSSHFTRVARIFALELGVPHAFEPVYDLRSVAAGDYAGNPALRMPILKHGAEVWFGALPICRVLARSASRAARIAWPEALESPLLSNAQELTLQAMATGVELLMSAETGSSGYADKRRASLTNSLGWLDQHVDAALAALPERDTSYLETTLFCLTEHLEFRQVLSTRPFTRLVAFCERFGERASARATPFVFDSPPSAASAAK